MDIVELEYKVRQLEIGLKKSDELLALLIAKMLDSKESTTDLMDVNQAADFLGITKATLYLKTSHKEVPFHKISGTKKLWFSRKELTDYIVSSK